MTTSRESATSALPRASLLRARVAVTIVFLAFGLFVGLWAAHIPVIQARLEISPATLGLALLCAAAGSLLSQVPLGMLLARTGSRIPTIASVFIVGSAATLAVWSPNVPALFGAVFYIGAAFAALNVGMNTQASAVESIRGLPTMSSFHAAASLGMLLGAVVGGILIGMNLGDGTGVLLVALIVSAASLGGFPFLVHDEPRERGPVFVVPNRAVFALGALAFLMFLVEGAMVDWSGLFLAEVKGASPAWAAAGFAIFTGAMAATRSVGNQIVIRVGRKATIVGGAVFILLGTLVAVLAPSFVLAAIGFGLIGVGAANVVPILMSTAAQTPGMSPSIAVGAVGTMMTLGFLVGPPAIGFVSQSFGLPVGLSIIGGVAVIVAVGAFVRRWPDPAGS